jgi:hypothetical protein
MSRWLVLLAIASVALSGCGGGGDGSPDSVSGSAKPRTATFGGPDNGRPLTPTTPGSGAAQAPPAGAMK